METPNRLKLPKMGYGPICLRILNAFVDHHNLSEYTPLPVPGDSTEKALEKIFEIMMHSMGTDKRKELLEECHKYYSDLPPSLR